MDELASTIVSICQQRYQQRLSRRKRKRRALAVERNSLLDVVQFNSTIPCESVVNKPVVGQPSDDSIRTHGLHDRSNEYFDAGGYTMSTDGETSEFDCESLSELFPIELDRFL